MNVDRLASSFSIDIERPIVGGQSDRITRLDQRRRIRAFELDETLAIIPKAMIAPIVLAGAMVPLFWMSPVREQALELFGLVALLALGIVALARRAHRHIGVTVSVDLGRQIAGICALCLGTAWGAIPIALFATANGDQRLMLLALLLGMIADVLMFGPILTVCLAFLAPMLAGALIGIALGGNTGSIALAGCVAAATITVVTALRRLQVVASLRIADRLLTDERDQTIETLLLDFQENSSDWLWELDASLRLHNVSGRVAEAADLPLRRLEGMKFTSLFRAGRVSALVAGRKPFRQELVEVATTGIPIWWRISGKPIHDETGAFVGYRGIGIDITQIRNAETRINYLATFDSLTGLANRVQFQGHLARECEAVLEDGHWRALLYLDLDGFKGVNDGFGHAAGDALLKDVARRLSSCVPKGAMVARLGGDEFGVWYPAGTPTKAETLADAIIEIIAAPFDVQGTAVLIGVSIGIAFTPKHGIEPDTLLGKADLALYRAKAEGKGLYRVFVDEYEISIAERRELQGDLKLAIARQEFELHYQPIVDLSRGKITGFEALIRWHSPARGFISPADFIPAAETTGQIVAIGRWVLFQACKEAMRWPDDINVAVNVSPQQFRAPDFVQTVVLALKTTRLPPGRLEIEVTEGVFFDNSPSAMTNLHALRERGVRIALDDFGTGYSSLSYLINFPVDKIKIDRSFVRDCATRRENQIIVDAILTIAKKLSIRVTAEGVETVEQALALQLRRCDEIQGFLFSKPRPLADIPDMIADIPVQVRNIFPMGFESPLALALAMKK